MTPNTANLNSWEHQFVRGYDPKYLNTISWTDAEALGRYPHLSWVYDRLELSQRMAVKAWDLERETPDEYPVFVKPRFNVWNSKAPIYKVTEPAQIKDRAGLMAQEFLRGGYLTTDFVIFDSEVADYFTFIGHRDLDDEFVLFESTQSPSEEAYLLAEIVSHHGYGNGILNVETIRGKVISASLKPTSQFFDISCRLYQQAMACFYKNKSYTPRVKTFEKTYSAVYRQKHDALCIQKYTPEKTPSIRSIQLCWDRGIPLSTGRTNQSHKAFILNGTDMKAIDDMALRVFESIQFRYL